MKLLKVYISIILLMVLSTIGIGEEIRGGIVPDIVDLFHKSSEKIAPDESEEIRPEVAAIMFINELDVKKKATYGDALRMFGFQPENPQAGPYRLKSYKDDSPLTKGMASLMTVRYLKLGNSLMYNFLDIERYAYRECCSDGLFDELKSENDRMSGPELIELFTKINERQRMMKTVDNG